MPLDDSVMYLNNGVRLSVIGVIVDQNLAGLLGAAARNKPSRGFGQEPDAGHHDQLGVRETE